MPHAIYVFSKRLARMKVISRFSKLYAIQLCIGYVGGLTVIILLSYFSELNFENPLFWLACMVTALYTHTVIDLLTPKSLITEIAINEIGLGIKYQNSKEQTIIGFDKIDKIRVRRLRLRISRNPINDGYFETLIILKDKSIIVISESQFDNYDEIMKAIQANYKSAHEA